MTTTILRTDAAWWVETPDGAARVDTDATTTAELLADRAAVDAAATSETHTAVQDLALVSPITAPCRVVAQMVNFASHARDSNIDPTRVPATFFRKTSGSISGPFGTIDKPPHVRLLDYEVEAGIVFGRTLPVGTEITADTLADHAAGLVIGNDVSARDVQLPKTQFYESKSYPTFTPLGPRLVLLDRAEWAHFERLRLQLWVNGERRQNGVVGDDMIVRPTEALRVLTGFQRLDPGDVLLTGTPGGTALTAPPAIIEKIGALLPPHRKWATFFRRQASNPRYLQDGDEVEVRIATDDVAVDLGRQRTRVRYLR
ncbi:fumarylacetoacetate hydrolase family protein [Williamsia deligens]|uniref:Fumarylacetoacetate hydrolase family protein n=1 Tax=Williamsia deligens TaxID=321325 RepID=A0ABW3G4R0_9NOCA|nr:fumarylacetoacetate hydrolase family protein [Williamsia deligens]MCP2193665.1 2-keto-4-pentenoate hydratase/2-oxohepta-3-ene-1,7-dioic acid hydratase (catechol pathway) [Williamsia deligens]